MHHITIQYAADRKLAPVKKLLCHWAEQALGHVKDDTELTIRIVDIYEMTALNETYRKKTGPTNVLSFPADIPAMAADDYPLLGDIVICAAVVNREAEEQHKPQQAHWAHMVVHGVFHLLGHDHEQEDEATIMEALEIKVLQTLGFSNPYIDGEVIKHHE
jgi:probable rRNA maturation factor